MRNSTTEVIEITYNVEMDHLASRNRNGSIASLKRKLTNYITYVKSIAQLTTTKFSDINYLIFSRDVVGT